ncbi:MAG: hypothetical protein WCG27_11755 [Pseudomonadota bacterium]
MESASVVQGMMENNDGMELALNFVAQRMGAIVNRKENIIQDSKGWLRSWAFTELESYTTDGYLTCQQTHVLRDDAWAVGGSTISNNYKFNFITFSAGEGPYPN